MVAAARAPSSLPQPLRERGEEGTEPGGCWGASAASSPLQPRGCPVFFMDVHLRAVHLSPHAFGRWAFETSRVSVSETSPTLPGPLSCAAPCGLRNIPVARCHPLHLCSYLGRNTQRSCREGSRSDAGAPVGFTHAASCVSVAACGARAEDLRREAASFSFRKPNKRQHGC